MKDWYWVSRRLYSIQRTGTGSVMDCRVHGIQELYLWWTAEYMEDWYWVYGGLYSIRRTGNGNVVDCRVYRGLVLYL